jgi:hypothetical protein
MSLNEMFAAMSAGVQASLVISDLSGRSLGLQKGSVVDVSDPLESGAIRVLLPSKPGYPSGWLKRLVPWHGLSVPAPVIGDTVLVGFVDGDQHDGFYLGIIQNQINPADDPENWVYKLGDKVSVKLTPEDITFTLDSLNLKLDTLGNVELTGVSSFKLNGKEVAVVGAGVSSGQVVTRGY